MLAWGVHGTLSIDKQILILFIKEASMEPVNLNIGDVLKKPQEMEAFIIRGICGGCGFHRVDPPNKKNWDKDDIGRGGTEN